MKIDKEKKPTSKKHEKNRLNTAINVFATLGWIIIIVSVLAILTYPFFRPDIRTTESAPALNEEVGRGIVAEDVDPFRRCFEGCGVSPDEKYRIEFEGVDDRGWVEKLVGLGYSTNGLTQIKVIENSVDGQVLEVALLRESDPGSGRSYTVTWSADSEYIVITGSVRSGDGSDPGAGRINYVFDVSEGQLYSR